MKGSNQGLGHPLVASALMDSILLPVNLAEYMKHSERALLNRLTELTYEVSLALYFHSSLHIFNDSFVFPGQCDPSYCHTKHSYYDTRLAAGEERIKTLEKGGH